MTEEMNFYGAEWSADEWTKHWTIHVGRAYNCSKCGTMVMITKGGIGVIKPRCCDNDMFLVEKADDIR